MLVTKKSNKPFKSKCTINRVKNIVNHPILNIPAFTFYEDDSIVECRQCEEIYSVLLNQNHFTIQSDSPQIENGKYYAYWNLDQISFIDNQNIQRIFKLSVNQKLKSPCTVHVNMNKIIVEAH